jgi:hypothetical protein
MRIWSVPGQIQGLSLVFEQGTFNQGSTRGVSRVVNARDVNQGTIRGVNQSAKWGNSRGVNQGFIRGVNQGAKWGHSWGVNQGTIRGGSQGEGVLWAVWNPLSDYGMYVCMYAYISACIYDWSAMGYVEPSQ